MINQQRTNAARAEILDRLAASCGGTLIRHDGFSVRLHGWKDYYLKALPAAPRQCFLCASGQGRFAFGDIRKGFGRPL